MRLRPYFAQTYLGMSLIGLSMAGVCALVSAAMFLFRPFCEPILAVVLTVLVSEVSRGGYFRYDPASYWFFSDYVAFLSLGVLVIVGVALIRKPGQDSHIEEALRRQTTDFAQGAALDPK
jgi:hypothetical protein